MDTDTETNTKQNATGIGGTLRRLFWDKKFLHYTITGLLISSLNVFLLWLLIDVLMIPTVTSGILVVGFTFILRYLLLVFLKIF